YFTRISIHDFPAIVIVFTAIAIASLFIGNLLALYQNNVKRILAYSSIAHLGYVLIAFLAGGLMAVTAVSYYLAAYFVTIMGAFGIVSVLSSKDRDADALDEYRGLAWRRPWLAGMFTLVLLSLAGIPLTAGFIGKFFVITAGAGSTLWLLLVALAISSSIGLYYYLRIITVLYAPIPAGQGLPASGPLLSMAGRAALAVLALLLIWLGVSPDQLLGLIKATAARLIY